MITKITVSLAVCVVVVSVGSAAAHVEPTIEEAPAGTRVTVGFAPTHGCGSSPTTSVRLQLPEGIGDPEAQPVPGWSQRVEGRVATWTGGSLPADATGLFAVRVTLPDRVGELLVFPTIQGCANGEELAWVQRPDDGSSGDRLAPVVRVVEPTDLDTTTTTLPPVEVTTTTAPQTPTTTMPTTTMPTTTSTASTTTTTATNAVNEVVEPNDTDLAPLLWALGAAALVGLGALLWRRSRQ